MKYNMKDKLRAGQIEFICELKGCNNKSVIPISTYKLLKKHLCSDKCKRIASNSTKITYKCQDANCTNTRTQYLKKYDMSFAHFCSRSCYRKNRPKRAKPETSLVSKKELSKIRFIDKWNKMKWEK